MATLKELAAMTGLSMNTVSRAIRGRGYVSERAAKLVRDAVRRLDYHPNKAAQALRRRSSSEIAVIVESYDALHLEKLAAVKEYAVRRGFAMRVYFINEEYPSSSLRMLLPEVMENQPAGLILITANDEIVRRGLELRKKLPCVIIAFDPVLIRNTGYLNGKMFAAMANPPDAVQTSDYMAAGLLAGFAAIGMRVPHDVAVLGFDNRDFAALLNPPLSTLAQPNFDVGKNAAALLFRRMNNPSGEPEAIRIPMALLVRQST